MGRMAINSRSNSTLVEIHSVPTLLGLFFKTVDPHLSFAYAQSCSFKKRGIFRRIFGVQAGHTSPGVQLSRKYMENQLITGENDWGVFINTSHPPIDRFLFFKVDDKRFYNWEAMPRSPTKFIVARRHCCFGYWTGYVRCMLCFSIISILIGLVWLPC